MQNMLGYGGESYVQKGVIRHYIGKARLSWVDIEDVSDVAGPVPQKSSTATSSQPARSQPI
jgi:hypothetical protein